MATLSWDDFINIDHTFKVTANLDLMELGGYQCTTHFFGVLSNVGQVIAWQLTQTSSLDFKLYKKRPNNNCDILYTLIN